MSEKMSEARKLYWSNISPDERSRRSRAIALLAWSKISPEDRSKRSKMILKKRYAKKS